MSEITTARITRRTHEMAEAVQEVLQEGARHKVSKNEALAVALSAWIKTERPKNEST